MLVATPDAVRTLAPPAPGTPLPPFNDAVMHTPNLATKVFSAIARRPRTLYTVLRWVAPILRIKTLVIVTRDADVREVLSRDADFPVPFGANFRALDPTGADFILGMPNSDTYRAIRAETMKTFSLQDLPRIAAFARSRSEAIVAEGGGSMDVARDLLLRVLIDLTRDYYGIDLPFPDGAHWLMAMSFYDFSPVADPAVRTLAQAASQHVASVVEAAIDRARAGALPDTIVARFVAAQHAGATVMTDAVIRATITGMMAGFIPTNMLATGHIVEMLLDQPDMMAACEAAARDGDDDLLDRCLFEALRFRPINPGPFRNCAAETTIAAGTSRQKTVRPGDLILACTGSAMFDPRRVRNPRQYDPARAPSDYLHFGFGQHWCIGFAIARAQMTQTFKPLLLRGPIRRASGAAGQMVVYGTFGDHLTITYDTQPAALRQPDASLDEPPPTWPPEPAPIPAAEAEHAPHHQPALELLRAPAAAEADPHYAPALAAQHEPTPGAAHAPPLTIPAAAPPEPRAAREPARRRIRRAPADSPASDTEAAPIPIRATEDLPE